MITSLFLRASAPSDFDCLQLAYTASDQTGGRKGLEMHEANDHS